MRIYAELTWGSMSRGKDCKVVTRKLNEGGQAKGQEPRQVPILHTRTNVVSGMSMMTGMVRIASWPPRVDPLFSVIGEQKFELYLALRNL